MQRIAAPMLGGIVTSALLSLLIIPILYEMYERRRLKHRKQEQ
jgi:Cu(I)/Ag(I) efflux system membrane protein CusA/SilA